MDIQTTIFNTLTQDLTREEREALVGQLADRLGIEFHVGAVAEQGPVENGQTVNTLQGEARAVVLDKDAQRALKPLLEALYE